MLPSTKKCATGIQFSLQRVAQPHQYCLTKHLSSNPSRLHRSGCLNSTCQCKAAATQLLLLPSDFLQRAIREVTPLIEAVCDKGAAALILSDIYAGMQAQLCCKANSLQVHSLWFVLLPLLVAGPEEVWYWDWVWSRQRPGLLQRLLFQHGRSDNLWRCAVQLPGG